ncbi:type II toxin-antitoxin system VapC family toxin [bacterium]|nr:type II toxin-antitoxin system VapC family toxin [bacterium]MCI0603305.1 type II toxin-antitoxin system VapC family toxin [bacterium]
MSYLLDTNIVSETIRRRPNRTVISWLDQIPGEALFVSVLTLGEVRKGIESVGDRRRQEKLRVWLEHELPAWFEGRVLAVDLSVADLWGRLLAEIRRPVPVIDSLLAATALRYELRLVTRNSGDFQYPGLKVINPWLET